MIFSDQTFAETEVVLDGNEYERCTFVDVRLDFSGRAAVRLHGCTFPPPNTKLGLSVRDLAFQTIWDLGVAYRFGDRVTAETAVLFVEGPVRLLPFGWAQGPRQHTLELLRNLHAPEPLVVRPILRFIRGEPQSVFREPVRVICRRWGCGQVSVMPSMLPPGSRRSVAHNNAATCSRCGSLAHIEDHGTDEAGRTWREFADQILRQPSVTPRDLASLRDATAAAPIVDTSQALESIRAITPAFDPLVEEAGRSPDRRTFLARMAILCTTATAMLWGSTQPLKDDEHVPAPVLSSAKSPVISHTHTPVLESRDPTDSEVLAQLEGELLAHCRQVASDPDTSIEDLERARSACSAIDRDRRLRDAATHSASYMRDLLQQLGSPNQLAAGFWALVAAVFASEISRRRGQRSESSQEVKH